MKKIALIAATAAAMLVAGTAQAQIAGRGGHPGGGHGGGGHSPGPRPGGGHGGGWNGGGWNGGGWNGGGWNGGGWNRGGWSNGSVFGGFAFGGYWQQPQYHVQNWQLYGFIQPQAQQRWVRYYDDAYLVDGGGRVFDSRRGVAWDRGGERWERDSYGIPYYVGRGDYYPDRGDYARADSERRWGGDWDYSGYGSDCGRPSPCGGPGAGGPGGRGDVVIHREIRRDGYDARRDGRRDGRDVVVYRDGRGDRDGYYYDERAGGYVSHDGRVTTRTYSAPGGAAYGYGQSGAGYDARYYGSSAGYGSGYGAGYGSGYGSGYGYDNGTVVVTETTVTPGQQIVTEEIIEEIVEAPPHRRAYRAPRRAAPAPAPRRHAAPPAPRPAPRQPSGERG